MERSNYSENARFCTQKTTSQFVRWWSYRSLRIDARLLFSCSALCELFARRRFIEEFFTCFLGERGRIGVLRDLGILLAVGNIRTVWAIDYLDVAVELLDVLICLFG